MNNSIYDIQNDLLDLFQLIEEQEGELTEEQEAALTIKREELDNKLEKYAKAVKQFELDVAACKEEEKRIKARRDVYTNRINRLKETMLEAVQNFGNESKSGAKFIELPTMRLGTRNSESVEVDETRSQALLDNTLRCIEEFIDNDVYEPIDNEQDVEDFVNIINSMEKARHEESPLLCDKEFVPYTIDDFNNIRCKINIKVNFIDLLKYDSELVRSLLTSNPGVLQFDCNPDLSKTELKPVLKEDNNITIAKLNSNTSLQIK